MFFCYYIIDIVRNGSNMKLTNATEKALAVVAMLATQEGNKPIPSSVIVEKLQISDSYTKKLLRKLVVGNVITSVPGNSGGFSLKRDISELSMLEIVEAIEGKVETYPNYGTIQQLFDSIPNRKQKDATIIVDMFNKSDIKWRDNLQKETIDKVIRRTFGTRKIAVNWLENR